MGAADHRAARARGCYSALGRRYCRQREEQRAAAASGADVAPHASPRAIPLTSSRPAVWSRPTWKLVACGGPAVLLGLASLLACGSGLETVSGSQLAV